MKYVELINVLSPVVCLVLGAFIGYVLDIRKNHKKKHADYNMIIFDIYKSASAEIIETITPLASLSLKPRGFTIEQLEEWRKKISELYFKHYTYLPQIVLNEMNCLHSCIQTGGKNLYCIKNENEIKICTKEDVVDLFDDTALVGGERERIGKLIDEYSIDRLSESLKINLQARRVIRIVSAIFEDKTINDWNTILKKETLLQVRSKKV
mgnify:CR=1 FL=1